MRTNENPWRTPEELSDWLGIPVGTIYQWRYRSVGPVGHRIGRHVRYHQTDIDRWLAEQRDDRRVP